MLSPQLEWEMLKETEETFKKTQKGKRVKGRTIRPAIITSSLETISPKGR